MRPTARIAPPDTVASGSGRALGRLIAADTKDFTRTLQTGFATLFLFGFFLLVIGSLDLAFSAASTEPKVTISGTDASIVSALEAQLPQHGLTVTSDPPEANLFVEAVAGRVSIVVDAEQKPSWRVVWQAVRRTGVSAGEITVTDSEGVWKADILQQNLAPAVGMGFIAIVFVGTAVPLVALRERGMLRLLGTTPVRSSSLVLSMIPARMGFAIVEIAVVLVIASSRSYVDAGMIWRLLATMVLSLAMLFPLAFLFAARARHAANMQQLMVALTMLLVGLGGGFVPPQIIPVPLQTIFNLVPTTWMIQAIAADLTGITPFMSIYLLWALMIIAAAAAFFGASRLFSWDRESRFGWRDVRP